MQGLFISNVSLVILAANMTTREQKTAYFYAVNNSKVVLNQTHLFEMWLQQHLNKITS